MSFSSSFLSLILMSFIGALITGILKFSKFKNIQNISNLHSFLTEKQKQVKHEIIKHINIKQKKI